MKTPLLYTGLAAAGVFCAFQSDAAPNVNLEGKWKIVAAPTDWKIVRGTSINVTGSEIQVRLGPVTGSTFRYSADYGRGEIDAAKSGEKPRLGKFALSGETVTIAVGEPGGPRPASISSHEKGVLRWVFKRTPQAESTSAAGAH